MPGEEVAKDGSVVADATESSREFGAPAVTSVVTALTALTLVAVACALVAVVRSIQTASMGVSVSSKSPTVTPSDVKFFLLFFILIVPFSFLSSSDD